MVPDRVRPTVAKDLAERLTAAGWTVRKLKAQGFGTKTAETLLGKTDGLPDLDVANDALALLGRELWHRHLKHRRA